MRVEVGYSENPDTAGAGIEAARAALSKGNRERPCDMVLMFSTARHDPDALRQAVATVTGKTTRIVGGGAIGAMTNERLGYAGDQVGLAAFWLDRIRCEVIDEGGLVTKGEEEVGRRLGRRLSERGTTPESPVMLFYDAINRKGDDFKLIMATPLLAGLEQGLGFLPDLTGAGLQGDFTCSATKQWTGFDTVQHHAFTLAFDGDLRIDNVIMHGSRPASDYFTVTKAEGPVVLEIDGEPAVQFIEKILGPSIPPEEYAFFLTFGINSGDKWGEFDEKSYANRLCIAIDKERGGIVMFEPDMVAGTEFQIMHRALDLDYIAPKIEALFDRLAGRKPVFTFYIDCGGRAAGYSGGDLEDGLMVQQTIAGRVPFLGIYSGVEIAAVMGRPRALDWTGVFCLFSVPE